MKKLVLTAAIILGFAMGSYAQGFLYYDHNSGGLFDRGMLPGQQLRVCFCLATANTVYLAMQMAQTHILMILHGIGNRIFLKLLSAVVPCCSSALAQLTPWRRERRKTNPLVL